MSRRLHGAGELEAVSLRKNYLTTEGIRHLTQLLLVDNVDKWLQVREARKEMFMSFSPRVYQYDPVTKYKSTPFSWPINVLCGTLGF